MKPQAIVMELAGTLARFEAGVVGQRWAAALGLEPSSVLPMALAAAQSQPSLPEAALRLAVATRLDEADASALLADILRTSWLDPRLEDLLHAVHGRLRTGLVASGASGPEAFPDLELRLAGKLGPSVQPIGEPDAATYREVAARLDVPPAACLAFASQPASLSAARRAGMQVTLAVDSSEALAGWRRLMGLGERWYRAAGGVVVDSAGLMGQRPVAQAPAPGAMPDLGPRRGVRDETGAGAATRPGVGERARARARTLTPPTPDTSVLLLHRPDRCELRLPKGHVETGEEDHAAALREVVEEGGWADVVVTADLGSRLVEFDRLTKAGAGAHVLREEHFFLMRLTGDARVERPAADQPFLPRWHSWAEAQARLTYSGERSWLAAAAQALAERPWP